jgi:hypothetical protein
MGDLRPFLLCANTFPFQICSLPDTLAWVAGTCRPIYKLDSEQQW